MAIDRHRHEALAALRTRIARLEVSDYEMWLAYLQCGGNGDPLSFQAYLHGALAMADNDWAALQHSVWEAENF